MPLAGIATTGVIAPSEQGLLNQFLLVMPLWGLLLDIAFRVRVGGTAGGVVQPDGPLGLIQKVRVTGNHRDYGNRELINLTGPELATLFQKYSYGQTVETVSNL